MSRKSQWAVIYIPSFVFIQKCWSKATHVCTSTNQQQYDSQQALKIEQCWLEIKYYHIRLIPFTKNTEQNESMYTYHCKMLDKTQIFGSNFQFSIKQCHFSAMLTHQLVLCRPWCIYSQRNTPILHVLTQPRGFDVDCFGMFFYFNLISNFQYKLFHLVG